MTLDAEGLAQAFIAARFPDVRAVTVLPGDVGVNGVVAQVARVGGPQRLSLASARISVQVFVPAGSDDRRTARARAQDIADGFLRSPGFRTDDGVITGCRINSGPQVLDYENPNVRRAQFLIDMSCHAAAAA